MKAAFAHWDNRIAPVFDTAQEILLVEVEAGTIVRETREQMADMMPVQQALWLVELGVGSLVCGAISNALQTLISSYGIQVLPFVAGDMQEIIHAWLNGTLERSEFAMPGCCGRGRRLRWKICGINKEENEMNGKGRGRAGKGGGQGQGRGGHGHGRMGGPLAAGDGGTCVCPKCGHREPHERGTPCAQSKCPQCGAAMTRE